MSDRTKYRLFWALTLAAYAAISYAAFKWYNEVDERPQVHQHCDPNKGCEAA